MMRGFLPFAFVGLVALILLIPLEDSKPVSAQSAYDHAWRLFQTGYLALSQQEAAAGFDRFSNSDASWANRFRRLEADSMLFRGMYKDALDTLASYSADGASDGSVERLAIQAVAFTRQEEIPQADRALATAEAYCKSADFPSCGDAIASRGILATKLGQFDAARQYFVQSLAYARSHNNDWLQVSSNVNLGYTAMQVDHYDEAVEWSRAAYQSAAAKGYENLELNAAGNLGWAYYQLGDNDRALDQFLAAEKAAARLGNVRNELKWLGTEGGIYGDAGDWPRALASFQQELALARKIDSKEDIEFALQDLAEISVDSGQLDNAADFIHQATETEAGTGRQPTASLLLAMGKLAAGRNQFAQAETDFHAIQNDSASLMTTKLRAGFELAKLFETQNKLPAAESMYTATLADYEADRAQLKSEESLLPFGANAAQIYDRYVQLLVKQGRTDAALAVADQSRAQALEQSLQPKRSARPAAVNPKQIARETNSDLLFYWLGEERSFLWVITPAQTRLFTLPDRKKISAAVDRYSKALLDLRDPLDTANADGQELYQELVAPAMPMLHSDRPAIVLTDGILSQLNFESLLVPGSTAQAQKSAGTNNELHYLIDDLTLSSAPSLAMLAAGRDSADAGGKMLLLGNPVSPSQDFPSLPMFGFEMGRVESHFKPAQLAIYAGQQATPSAYLGSNLAQYAYIHFVSHAVASSMNPLESAIILSNPSGSDDAYKLYANEIIQHPIDAKLVTISACYGSGTRAFAGEGLVGLSWAFLRAGAQRVIGALWEVSDESTARLMDTLYQGLAAGQPPAVALRNAKLALLHSQSRFRMPYYWAPFVIYSRR